MLNCKGVLNMVNPAVLVVVAIGVVAFIALDGIKKTSTFINSLQRGSLPIINPRSTPLRDSEVTEVRTEEGGNELESISVVSRSGKTTAKPSQLTTTAKPNISIVALSAQQSGAIAGVSNISTGERIVLSSKEVADLRAKPLTAQEQADVAALAARKARKTPEQQLLKTDPLELVLQKREQELISKKQIGESNFVGGKLFANPDFPLFFDKRTGTFI